MFRVHSGIPKAYSRQYNCCKSVYIYIYIYISVYFKIYTTDYSCKLGMINCCQSLKWIKVNYLDTLDWFHIELVTSFYTLKQNKEKQTRCNKCSVLLSHARHFRGCVLYLLLHRTIGLKCGISGKNYCLVSARVLWTRWTLRWYFLNFLHDEMESLYLTYHDAEFSGDCPVFMQTDGLCHIWKIQRG